MPVTDRHTEPDESTVAAEEAEAAAAHASDRPPTDEESADAEREFGSTDEDERRRVAEHEREMNELGARAKGEGRIS
jgi:F0F1-type ATP synthase epsilon subunit